MRHLLRFLLASVLIGLLVTSLTGPAPTAARPETPDSMSSAEAAKKVLGLVNGWRIEEGLWPLKENTLLDQMAATQAAYIIPKISSIVDDTDYHKDAQGRMPRERAGQPPYDWPPFQRSNHSDRAIGENAAVGSPEYALNFWKSSPIHRKAALNGQYREVGVAAIPLNNSFAFIMDFGARPGVLTVLTDATDSTLYLPNELSRFIVTDPGAMQIRLFDSNGVALTDLMPWQATLTLPKGVKGKLEVLYTNGSYQALSLIDLSQDIAVLPSGKAATAIPTFLPTATETATPQTAAQDTAQAQTTSDAPHPTNTAAPASTPIPTPAPSSATSLVLFYDPQSLVVYNNSKRPLDLSDLSISNDNGRISIAGWNSISAFPITAFPGGQCLEIEIIGSNIPEPVKCLYIRSVAQVSAVKAFWTQGDFMVKRGDATLATCAVAATRCEVNLPAGK